MNATEQRHAFKAGDHYEATKAGEVVAMAETVDECIELAKTADADEVRRVTQHGQTVGRACWRSSRKTT